MRSPSARRVGVPLVVGLVVLALVLLVIRLADPPGEGVGGAGGSVGDGGAADVATGGPPPLRLGSYLPAAERVADRQLQLRGDLPHGPDAAAVYRLTPAVSDGGSRLATALGLVGEPTEDAGGGTRVWTSEGGDAQLVVQEATGQWSYTGIESFGGTVSSDGSVSGGSADPDAPVSSGIAPRDQHSVSPDTTVEQALTTARRLADRAGLELRNPAAGAGGPWVTVRSERDAAGLPAAGLATTVTVRGSSVQAADGWLVETREGPTYDVVSAPTAFDLLTRAPTQLPATVTGARFGLSLQWEAVRPILVPSWLFTVEGSDLPLVQVAVDPVYLAAPEPPPAPSTDGDGGGSPGGAGTAEPVPVEPPGREPAAEQPLSQFTAVSRGADDRALQVRFWGGVEECNDYRVLTEETAGAVVLRLAHESVGDGPCIELAQEHRRTVRLAEPLGLRRVVDAVTDEVLLGPTR